MPETPDDIHRPGILFEMPPARGEGPGVAVENPVTTVISGDSFDA